MIKEKLGLGINFLTNAPLCPALGGNIQFKGYKEIYVKLLSLNYNIFSIMEIIRQARLFSQKSSYLRYYCKKLVSQDEIKKMISKNKVVVFMKGIPAEPRCGFSNAVVQILRMHGVEYDSHNVLDDESLRQGIKDFSQWPTIPQVYINGEFVGGSDIMLQMHQSGDLIEELEKAGIKSALLGTKEVENKKE